MQELRSDLLNRDALDANVLRGRVAVGVVALVHPAAPETVGGGEGRNHGVPGGQVRGDRGGAE